MRDWPIAPPNTAIAKPTPAANARYLLTEKLLSPAPPAPSPTACAKTVMPLARIPTTAKSNILNLLMLPPLIRISTHPVEQTATILFRLLPVSTAPLTTALLREQTCLAMSCLEMLVSDLDMSATFAGALACIAHRTL